MAISFNDDIADTRRSGATDQMTPVEVATFLAAGTVVTVPIAVFAGSAKSAAAIGGTSAVVLGWSAHRQANGKPIWPFDSFDKKTEAKSDDKADDKKEDDKSSD